jgi:choline dehydrogenase-like flavoprotein
MIKNLNYNSYDVCIIGGGIAGALVAYKLGLAGIKVIVLEAGPRHDVADRHHYMDRFLNGDNPWRSDIPERDIYTNGGEVEYPLNKYRVKAVGGSTLHWQGYATRLHESDFEMRSRYGIAEDWPITYEDLEPYYCQAEEELGVSGDDDNPFGPPRSKPYPLPGFPAGYAEKEWTKACKALGIQFRTIPQARTSVNYRGRPACMTYSVCSACPIRARYSGDIHIELAEQTGKVNVVPNANVVRFESNGSGGVKRVVFATPDKKEHQCIAGIYILAAHGVESPRLLLLSKSLDFPDGFSNSSGKVGRYFMDHTGRYQQGRVKAQFYPFRKGFYTVGTQQFYEKPTRDHEAAFTIAGIDSGPRPRNIAKDIIRYGGHWGLDLEIKNELKQEFGKYFGFGSMVEPLPSEKNRVELDYEKKDFFGNPCPKIFYSISDYERETFKKVDKITKSMFEALGAEKQEVHRLGYGGHHSGTCRMGNDPRTSVVDKNLRAHDVKNLFIVGSSVFVTVGAANPTLTIAALALRLGEHLLKFRGPA